MFILESELDQFEGELGHIKAELEKAEFTLGGNWDYEHGFFDRALDEGKKLWLRLPFETTGGKLDSEIDGADTTLRFGKPFVLKHVYNEGLDGESTVGVYRFLIDQFQSPLDPDAELSGEEVKVAEAALRRAESMLLH